ncbi:hypothetical protein BC834DRAFT_670699 [Gloeopeniophorella convolvens]|nr:hypothetical protein BC834DRAFT_670699 [Gloeopeniophorella convolvens]
MVNPTPGPHNFGTTSTFIARVVGCQSSKGRRGQFLYQGRNKEGRERSECGMRPYLSRVRLVEKELGRKDNLQLHTLWTSHTEKHIYGLSEKLGDRHRLSGAGGHRLVEGGDTGKGRPDSQQSSWWAKRHREESVYSSCDGRGESLSVCQGLRHEA